MDAAQSYSDITIFNFFLFRKISSIDEFCYSFDGVELRKLLNSALFLYGMLSAVRHFCLDIFVMTFELCLLKSSRI